MDGHAAFMSAFQPGYHHAHHFGVGQADGHALGLQIGGGGRGIGGGGGRGGGGGCGGDRDGGDGSDGACGGGAPDGGGGRTAGDAGVGHGSQPGPSGGMFGFSGKSAEPGSNGINGGGGGGGGGGGSSSSSSSISSSSSGRFLPLSLPPSLSLPLPLPFRPASIPEQMPASMPRQMQMQMQMRAQVPGAAPSPAGPPAAAADYHRSAAAQSLALAHAQAHTHAAHAAHAAHAHAHAHNHHQHLHNHSYTHNHSPLPFFARLGQPFAPQQRMAVYPDQNEDLARFQELSDKWQPDHNAAGPLVSRLLDSSAITTEYANADPVYQIKTAALPQTFSNYRTCRGDGHCGWRAVAFCYFEALCRHAEPYKFAEEVARLKSMDNILAEAGFQKDILDDFSEPFHELLRTLPNAHDGVDLVQQTLNDENQSLCIITYLKSLTSAYMKKYPDDFLPWVLESCSSVQEYCLKHVEPVNCEIEEVGLNGLLKVLVRPSGITTEVHYLDRSAGEAINAYEYPADPGTSPHGTIRLLYRPGHYDILYKPSDLAPRRPVPGSSDVLIALQQSSGPTFRPELLPSSTWEPLAIPGDSFYPGGQSSWSVFHQFDPTPSPISPGMPTPAVPPTPSYHEMSGIPAQDLYFPATQVSIPPMSRTTIGSQLGIDSASFFRPNAHQFFIHPEPEFRTPQFRESSFNKHHHENPDFEPDQWIPPSELTRASKSRKKSVPGKHD